MKERCSDERLGDEAMSDVATSDERRDELLRMIDKETSCSPGFSGVHDLW
jgi:hypothetical protein